MPKRPYPHKSAEERRIPVSFSLSGERLKNFRSAYAAVFGYEPTEQECKEKAGDLAYHIIDHYGDLQALAAGLQALCNIAEVKAPQLEDDQEWQGIKTHLFEQAKALGVDA